MSPTELRFAGRALCKNPGTSLLAVLALALGIGLTTAQFSVVHGTLMSALPFAEPGRLADVTTYDLAVEPPGFQPPQVLPHEFLDWREQQTSFENLAGAYSTVVNLNGEDGHPERYQAGRLTWNVLRLLGVDPVLGRDFTAEDAVSGAAPVALLGHELWRHRFASDPAIVGRSLRLDGEPTTVIGVMPAGFEYPIAEELWLPMDLDVSELGRGEGTPMYVIGRLHAGVALGEAQAEFSALAERLAAAWPDVHRGRGIAVSDYRASLNATANEIILPVMLAAVSLVLLIACANVASLLLARSAARAGELAIRSALGARRRRLIGLLMTESVVLSLLGALLGLGLAHANVSWLERVMSFQGYPFWISFEIRWPTVVFAGAVGVLTGLVAGSLPAFKASGAASFDLLKDEARGAGPALGRLTRGLVVGEIALACALLVAAVLMVRSVRNYLATDPGFATESIHTAGLTVPPPLESPPGDTLAENDDPSRRAAIAFFERLVDELIALPEVENATVMSSPPGTFMGQSRYALEGASYSDASEYPRTARGVVSPEFFATYGIALVEGRLFDRRDRAETERVVIVNASFAAENWPNQSALGQRLRFRDGEGGPLGGIQGGKNGPWHTVVGLVPDAGVASLTPAVAGLTAAGLYVPHAQVGWRTMSIAMKARGEPSSAVTLLRRQLARIDPTIPVDDPKTMDVVVWEQLFPVKVISLGFGICGAAALLLAAVGIFGIMLFSVHQRRREIGIRMALGASPWEVLGLVLRQGFGRVVLGLALGLVLAWGLASTLRIILYGVGPGDPMSFAVAIGVLILVALAACGVPALRAARVDPLIALRYE